MRAWTRNAAPAAVSSTERVVRTSSGAPTCASSWATAALKPCWAMNKRLAARVELNSSATTTKHRSNRGLTSLTTSGVQITPPNGVSPRRVAGGSSGQDRRARARPARTVHRRPDPRGPG